MRFENGVTQRISRSEGRHTEKQAQLDGYRFAWGRICERRSGAYLVWDFCLDALLLQYSRNGLSLVDLQRAVFEQWERRTDRTTRDILEVLTPDLGWKILPCSTVGAFSLVVHFTEEAKARLWTAELIRKDLPAVIGQLGQNVNEHRG
ncbi:MAG: hypothetical protein ACU84J_06460 [Gammaproteobacteria bacterium]